MVSEGFSIMFVFGFFIDLGVDLLWMVFVDWGDSLIFLFV